MGFQPAAFTALHTCQTSLQILGSKKARIQTQMQINNVLAGYLWSQLHLHLANVHKRLVWHTIYLFMYVSSFLNAYFNNRGVTSEITEQVLN